MRQHWVTNSQILVDSGVDGNFSNGTMGAFALPTDADQHRAVETIVNEVDRKVPVIAGISDTGTKRVIEKGKQIEKVGTIGYGRIRHPHHISKELQW